MLQVYPLRMKPKVYLDNCCYGRPYDDQSQIRIHLEAQAKLAIQSQIVEERYILVASSFLLYENSAKQDESVKTHIFEYIDANMRVFVEEGEDPSLGELIKEIMNGGIKTLDASHLASAIYSGCDYFITTDDRILKYRTDRIRILNPVQFVTEQR